MADIVNHSDKVTAVPHQENIHASLLADSGTNAAAKSCSESAISGAQATIDKHFGSCVLTDAGEGRVATFYGPDGKPSEATAYNKDSHDGATGKLDGSDNSTTVKRSGYGFNETTVTPGPEDQQKGLGETTKKADGHVVVKGPNGEELTISPDGFSKLDMHDGKPPILNPFGGKQLTHEQMDKIAHSKMLGISKDAHNQYQLKIPADQ
jgi:hypothetical protein